jgi:hypothetical protein
MTASDGDGINGFRPQFIGELPELVFRQLAQVGWYVDLIEQG